MQPAGGRDGVFKSSAKPHTALSQHQRAFWLWPLNFWWHLLNTQFSNLWLRDPYLWPGNPSHANKKQTANSLYWFARPCVLKSTCFRKITLAFSAHLTRNVSLYSQCFFFFHVVQNITSKWTVSVCLQLHSIAIVMEKQCVPPFWSSGTFIWISLYLFAGIKLLLLTNEINGCVIEYWILHMTE